jgi:hypothetical protein
MEDSSASYRLYIYLIYNFIKIKVNLQGQKHEKKEAYDVVEGQEEKEHQLARQLNELADCDKYVLEK